MRDRIIPAWPAVVGSGFAVSSKIRESTDPRYMRVVKITSPAIWLPAPYYLSVLMPSRQIEGRKMEAGFCGLGNMGTAMVSRFLAQGHRVTVWNRTAGKATPLLDRGAV